LLILSGMSTKTTKGTLLAILTLPTITLAITRPALAADADDQVPGQHIARSAPPPLPPPTVQERAARFPTTTALRASAVLDLFGGSAYALEVSHRFGPRLGVDVAFGSNDMGYKHLGTYGEALARLYTSRGPGAFSLALGPSVRTGTEFGAVGFLRAEVAAEYRVPGVPNILFGFGPEMALNDSGSGTCPDTGWFACFLWKDHWQAGDIGFRARVAAGWTF
jgi:hypothetical protein